MIFRSQAPSPRLAPFVDSLWLYGDAPRHTRERILPSGTFELVVNLVDDEFRIYDPSSTGGCRRYPGAMVSGPYAEIFVIDATQQSAIVGVHFKPGGAFPFLGVPAHEPAHTHVGLEALWGPSAHELRDRLCGASTARERFGILESALASRLSDRPRRHAAVVEALAALDQPAASVREVARQVGLSQRRFIQVFAECVGQTPKLYGLLSVWGLALVMGGVMGGLARPARAGDGTMGRGGAGQPAPIVHVRYLVHDVEAATAFYTRLLGFAVERRPAPGFAGPLERPAATSPQRHRRPWGSGTADARRTKARAGRLEPDPDPGGGPGP